MRRPARPAGTSGVSIRACASAATCQNDCVPIDFDEMSRVYDTPDKVTRSRAIAAAIADAIPLSVQMTALDYGCGTGILSWEMAPFLGHITLADSSEGMREVAAERLAERPDAARFTLIDLDLAIQPAPATYDLVYSSLVLHHIDDTAGILRAMFAAVNPGGWVAIADLDHDDGNRFHPQDFAGHTGFHRHALQQDVLAAGFEQPAFRTATTLTKGLEGSEQTFDVFLLTARKPG